VKTSTLNFQNYVKEKVTAGKAFGWPNKEEKHTGISNYHQIIGQSDCSDCLLS